jgi:hypothetical protein
MIGEYGDVLRTSRLYLQHEGPHGGLSTEGERSSMVEDAPAAAEHGSLKTCLGNYFEERFRERYPSEEFIERQLNEFNALTTGRSYGARVRGTFHGAAPVCSAP